MVRVCLVKGVKSHVCIVKGNMCWKYTRKLQGPRAHVGPGMRPGSGQAHSFFPPSCAWVSHIWFDMETSTVSSTSLQNSLLCLLTGVLVPNGHLTPGIPIPQRRSNAKRALNKSLLTSSLTEWSELNNYGVYSYLDIPSPNFTFWGGRNQLASLSQHPLFVQSAVRLWFQTLPALGEAVFRSRLAPRKVLTLVFSFSLKTWFLKQWDINLTSYFSRVNA